MTRIRNITGDTLNVAGHELAAGETVELNEVSADIAVTRNPAKFEVVSIKKARKRTAPPHRHRYQRNGTCRCGRMRGQK